MQETKFTFERREAILKDMESEIPYAIIAPKNGVSAKNMYRWLQVGNNHLDDGTDSEYAKFAMRVKAIEFTVLKKHLKAIEAKTERWQSRAWLLERRWWKYYSSSAAVVDFQERLEELAAEGKNIDAVRDDLQQVKEDIKQGL